MAATRILLGDIAEEWKSMVEEIASGNPDIRIIGQVQTPIDVLLSAKNENVDVILLSQERDGSEPGVCSHVVLEFPELAVVLVPAKDGRNVIVRIARSKEECGASKEALTRMLLIGVDSND